VLVVVDVVTGVAVVPVDVVDVVPVGDDCMAAAIRVHVHVPRVRDVGRGTCGLLVHVIPVNVVDMAVMQEVDMIFVLHRRVSAVALVDVRVLLDRMVRGGVGHRYLRPPR
jgi:hypothetical protein